MKLTYQLYSSRNHPPLDKTLAMLAAAGYKAVEGYAHFFGEDYAAKVAAVQAAGLEMKCAHFGIEDLENDWERCMAIAKAFGLENIYSPYLMPADRPTNAEGWQALGARLAEIGKKVNDAGYGFGWHNHDFELVKLPDGSVPLDLIFGASDDLQWEADLAWVVRGSADPLAEVKKHQARITAVHIKDIAPEGECADEDGWADVGHGTMDWKGLLEALQASPVKHFIAEHDKPSEDDRFARRTAEFLLAL